MKVQILDAEALKAISPASLAACARGNGWRKNGTYGEHADVYIGENAPEIVVPRTDLLGDYASVVSRLIDIFSEVTRRDSFVIYRELAGADHDVVRVRMIRAEEDGCIPIDEGITLVSQSREMLLAAACATRSPRPVYRAGANREATEYMKRVRLGQTEHGSFVVALMAPVPPILQPALDESWTNYDEEPYERQVTRRLVQALEASNEAVEQAHSGDGARAFERAVASGVSANLCGAVARLTEHSRELEISVSWAKTRPTPEGQSSIRFSASDADAFKEAERIFRSREPRAGIPLFGIVYRLARKKYETEGQVTFRVDLDGKTQSVNSLLDQRNYSVAIHAHEKRNPVIVSGDLERIKQRWRITNATVREITGDEDGESASSEAESAAP